MPGRIKQGQSVFIPFKDGESIYDSQNKARMYISKEKFRASFPSWRFGDVDLVEYVPKYSEAVPKWISVGDELPKKWRDESEELINYMVFMPKYGVDIGNYLKPANTWVCMGIPCKVTHWMPMPEPPKEEV